MKTFTITDEHIKLLSRLEIGYNDYTEFGAPEVDPKRPYGNSSVYEDIGEILGEEPTEDDGWGDKTYSREQKSRFLKVHKEMEAVLQILVRYATKGGIAEGETYHTTSNYGNDWTRYET